MQTRVLWIRPDDVPPPPSQPSKFITGIFYGCSLTVFVVAFDDGALSGLLLIVSILALTLIALGTTE